MAAKVQKISIALPREMIAEIRYAVDSGQYASTSEVIREAVREWKGPKKQRPFPPNYPIVRTREELLAKIDAGIAAAERGKLKPADEVFDRLEAKYQAMIDAQKKPARRRR
jgi:antitoxin ParD1/3/4